MAGHDSVSARMSTAAVSTSAPANAPASTTNAAQQRSASTADDACRRSGVDRVAERHSAATNCGWCCAGIERLFPAG